MKAIVIGGGFAGLTAAYRLQKAGWEAVVLEADETVGGRVRTRRNGGYLLELGATTLSTGFTEYNQLARELDLAREMAGTSSSILLMRKGRLYEVDERRPVAALLSGFLGLRSKTMLIRAARDLLNLEPRMNPLDVSACYAYDIESSRQYAERRLTREIYDVLVDPLIRAYTLRRGENVSCLEWFSALSNLFGQRMMGMRGGLQRTPLALGEQLDVRVSTPAHAVRRTERGVRVDFTGHSGAQDSDEADACVIATRLPEAAALFPEFGDKAATLIEKLPYNKALCVHLGYRARTRSRAIGVLVPTIEHEEIGLLWIEHNKNEDVAPKDHSLILTYFDAAVVDGLHDRDDESLASIAQEFIERLFPELRNKRDMMFVSRVPLAIPNPTVGAYAAIHALKGRLDPRDRIQLAGDYFTCTGQNSAIHYGNRAAANLAHLTQGVAT